MKIKKLTAGILAGLLMCLAVLPAQAADLEVSNAASELKSDAEEARMVFGYNYMTTPPIAPVYSLETEEKAIALYEEISAYNYETMEDVEAERAKLEEFYKTATVSTYELRFMISIFEKEDNSSGYYDEATWNEFNEVLEYGKDALENGSAEEIHTAYVAMRDEFDRLCLYNTTPGDINNDGVVDVYDATALQKIVAEMAVPTSSQLMVAKGANYVILSPSVDEVTTIQKTIAELDNGVSNYGSNITQLQKYIDEDLYDEQRFINFNRNNANAVYSRHFSNRTIPNLGV